MASSSRTRLDTAERSHHAASRASSMLKTQPYGREANVSLAPVSSQIQERVDRLDIRDPVPAEDQQMDLA